MNLVMLCLLLCGPAFERYSAVPAERDQPVTVRAQVSRDGQPLAGVPLGLRVHPLRTSSGGVQLTDGHGRCQWTIEKEGTDLRAEVTVCPPPRQATEAPAEYRVRYEAYRDLLHDNTFEREYVAEIPADVESVDLNIEVTNAVSASVSFTSDGQPVERVLIVGRRTSPDACIFRDGRWSIGGIPAGREYVTYVMHGNVYTRVVVPPCTDTCDLGTLELLQAELVVPMAVEVLDSALCEGFPVPGQAGFTLLSFDGRMAVTYLSPSWNAPLKEYSGAGPKAPVGRFYVLPFGFLAREAQIRLVERAAAGEDLSKIGVPVVELKPGVGARVSLSAKAVEDAALGAGPGGE